jgi:hypothetical protein
MKTQLSSLNCELKAIEDTNKTLVSSLTTVQEENSSIR